MHCIKTGCSILCDNFLFHGDLFFENGTVILSGVPRDSCYSRNNSYFDMEAREVFEIPVAGQYQCFLINDIFHVSEKLIDQFEKWESCDCISYFNERKK